MYTLQTKWFDEMYICRSSKKKNLPKIHTRTTNDQILNTKAKQFMNETNSEMDAHIAHSNSAMSSPAETVTSK